MTQSAKSLIEVARSALQRRDGAEAKRLLGELDGAAKPWLMLAQACNLASDVAGEEAALQKQLEAEPRNLPALLLTGELKARAGDDRAASSFFSAAVKQAPQWPMFQFNCTRCLHVRRILLPKRKGGSRRICSIA